MPGAARLGDISFCGADGHHCNSCSHVVSGPAIEGSPDVFINGLPALREGDGGIHAGCCDANQWTAKKGEPTVKINGKPLMRLGDMTKHCGGVGKVVQASTDVMAGAGSGGARYSESGSEASWLEIEVRDSEGLPARKVAFRASLPGGERFSGVTSAMGKAWLPSRSDGRAEISFPDNEVEPG